MSIGQRRGQFFLEGPKAKRGKAISKKERRCKRQSKKGFAEMGEKGSLPTEVIQSNKYCPPTLKKGRIHVASANPRGAEHAGRADRKEGEKNVGHLTTVTLRARMEPTKKEIARRESEP